MIISSGSSMNEAWETFIDIVYNQFQENMPVCLRRKYNTPWMNEESLKAIKQKKKAVTSTFIIKLLSIKQLQANNKVINKAKLNFESNMAEDIITNTKDF